ncbi:AAA family ATPase [Staphylococcus sp. ACRSN]|uniref:AAA family ATPase n=1 Tax=Staphylococcus sp. ACRSN TaxID=2918214 RepID=UPI001EF34459|nr:AAA family ATPase [Staphylococcus sp. ACRSN]MCG7338734.1 AAA family ATPase [Staphylococcus sp. ACRSN]
MSNIIVIRGNSGSGKTTIARKLQQTLGEGSFLISQDVVRRDMLKVKDKPNNLAIDLIKEMLFFGMKHCEFIILEGILANNKYGDMLKKTLHTQHKVFIYYYNLSFDVTVERHRTKNHTDFGINELKSWFVADDFIGIDGEKIITDDISKEQMLQIILKDIDYNNLD